MVGFDIDTIKLYVEGYTLSHSVIEFIKNLGERESRKIKRIEEKVYCWEVRKHKGFRISLFYVDEIVLNFYFEGSISNFYKGKVNILPFYEFENAIINLSNEFKVDFKNARVYRLDLACNIETDNPVNFYSNHLFVHLPRYKRFEQDIGVRFETDKKVFAIYDKPKELFDKSYGKIKIDRNILRFEFRMLNGIATILGIKNLKVSDLLIRDNFKMVVNEFWKTYQNIRKLNTAICNNEMQEINQKIFKNELCKMGVDALGGKKEAFAYLEDLDKQGRFKNRNNLSNCRKFINEMPSTLKNEVAFVEELNYKIEKYYTEFLESNY